MRAWGLLLATRMAAILALLGAGDATAATVRVVCEDGGGAIVAARGRRFRTDAACDVDRRCDGVCTVAVPNACLTCRFGDRRTHCVSPDAFEVSCEDPEPAGEPCPSGARAHAAAARPAGTGRLRFHAGRHVVAVRCRSTCSRSTTTTLPPAMAAVAGDWTFEPDGSVADCPPDRHAGLPPSPRQIRILQEGTMLTACRDREWIYADGGMVAGSGFVLGAGRSWTGEVWYDERLFATATGDRDVVETETRWSSEERLGGVRCTGTLRGRLRRVVRQCRTDADCFASDGCARCVDAVCRPLSRCRYDARAEWKRRGP